MIISKRLFSFFIFIIAVFPSFLYAQFSVETSGVISSENRTPFWFQSNRSGIYSSDGSQVLTRIQYHDSYQLHNNVDVYFGASIVARPGDQSTANFNQGYFKIRGYGIEFSAGRFLDPSPLYIGELGMGSLGVSTNAAPIPKVKLGFTDWTSIPFTKDFAQIMVYITHGWLGSERFSDDVLLHEKAFYLKAGGTLPVNFYGGLVHYVHWGGSNPDEGDIPNRFSDFIDIFLARGGDEATPGSDQAFVLGNQLGTWSFGSTIETDNVDINLFFQSPIETRRDLKIKNMTDFLTGILIDFPDDFWLPVNSFVYEYMFTKDQAGPRELDPDGDPSIDRFRGNQNYYNHQIYKTGWAYQFRTIGNPLFKADEGNLGIINNRIVAHHIGFESIFNQIKLFGKVTYSNNHGKRCDNRNPDIGEGELFGIQCDREVTLDPGNPLSQWSFLTGIDIPLPIIQGENIRLRVEAAFDNGRLFGDQFGILTSIRWTP